MEALAHGTQLSHAFYARRIFLDDRRRSFPESSDNVYTGEASV